MKPASSAASVRQRLLNHAKDQGEPFDFVLVRYGIERFLYRLGVSRWTEQFVLKGSMLFHVWRHTGYRPTRDVDLLDLAGDDIARIEKARRKFGKLAERAIPLGSRFARPAILKRAAGARPPRKEGHYPLLGFAPE